MAHRHVSSSIVALALLLAGACAYTGPTSVRSSALDFLYPGGTAAASPATDVTLQLPARVGLGFAPARAVQEPISEVKKQQVLNQVAEAFREHKGIGHIEVVPSAYLDPGGSFTNLDRVAASLGVDLMALVSYDQTTITESTRASWSYLTVVGPLFIKGEKNEIQTFVDAVVYDIKSRALLFRAPGQSTRKGKSNPLTVERTRRTMAEQGFDEASKDLIANLNAALTGFEEQAKSGAVRGAGTPAIAMYDKTGARVGSGGGGGGAIGLGEALLAALLMAGRQRIA